MVRHKQLIQIHSTFAHLFSKFGEKTGCCFLKKNTILMIFPKFCLFSKFAPTKQTQSRRNFVVFLRLFWQMSVFALCTSHTIICFSHKKQDLLYLLFFFFKSQVFECVFLENLIYVFQTFLKRNIHLVIGQECSIW